MKKYLRTTTNQFVDLERFVKNIEEFHLNKKIKNCKLLVNDSDEVILKYRCQDLNNKWYSSNMPLASGKIANCSNNIYDLVKKGDLVFTKKGTPLLVRDITAETFTQYDTFIEKKNICSIRVLQYNNYILVAEKKGNHWIIK